MTRAVHPLDRPVWNALGGRQAGLAITDGPAVRMRPDIGIFAAAADHGEDGIAALARLAGDDIFATLEETSWPAPPGFTVRRAAPCHQMLLETLCPPLPPVDFVELGAGDAPAMLALATLTAPGPFRANTHLLGGFIGIMHQGRLVAMAGERLKPEGFTEVSGVCTHPDHRGRGHAAALMRIVAERILARGETPILHSYSDNAPAIALYERLGFRLRRQMILTMISSS
ncbi:GNAT family N-acetyltransferase [Sphingomonas bacterium]|uniref:GNAT family N-acetyltransferase n=1 Tax=Sphingomonas bacterium TaxID=1895847 RepID=UPI0020C5D7F6|nr:GNAT family N-acetyltransferase [Sphingomonas bacterium]